MHKILLGFLLVSVAGYGQRVVADVNDSIPMFRVVTDGLDANQELIKQKGYISNITPSGNGGFDVWLFKQHLGYFKPQQASKALPANQAFVPGMTHIKYENGKLSLQKERIFSVSRNQEPALNYELLDITGFKGGVQTAGKVVLSNQETAGDFGRLLELQPKSVGFGKLQNNLYRYTPSSATEMVLEKYVTYFDPYIAQYMIDAKLTTRKKLKFEGGEAVMTGFMTKTDQALVYAAKPSKEDISIVRTDTTGKSTTTVAMKMPNAKVLTWSRPTGHSQDDLVNYQTSSPVLESIDLLLASCEGGVKCTNYTWVRVGSDGQIKYKQSFESPDPEMFFFAADINANDTECMVKLTLRKGLLKYHTFYVKLNETGLVYQTKLEGKDAKVFTSDGKPMMGGSSSENTLISLPNGENILAGLNFGLNGRVQPSSTQGFKGYGMTHIDAKGNIIDYYQAVSFMPANLPKFYAELSYTILLDGRILLMTLEGKDALVGQLQRFSTINRFFSDKHRLMFSQNSDSSYTQSLIERPRPSALGGFKLKGLNPTADQAEQEPSPFYELDTRPVNLGLVYYVVDLKKKSIQSYAMSKQGYVLSNPVLSSWYNRKTNELTTFLRTPDLPVDRTKRGPAYPREALLKTIQFKFNEM